MNMKGRLWSASTAGFFDYGRKKILPGEFCTLPKLRLGDFYLRLASQSIGRFDRLNDHL